MNRLFQHNQYLIAIYSSAFSGENFLYLAILFGFKLP